jgi:hypothetical protein
MTQFIIDLYGTPAQQIIDPTHVPSIGDQVAIHTPNTKVVTYREVRNVRYDYCDSNLTITAFV